MNGIGRSTPKSVLPILLAFVAIGAAAVAVWADIFSTRYGGTETAPFNGMSGITRLVKRGQSVVEDGGPVYVCWRERQGN